eukprot:10794657-Prorocentrum_lima.AAC.1
MGSMMSKGSWLLLLSNVLLDALPGNSWTGIRDTCWRQWVIPLTRWTRSLWHGSALRVLPSASVRARAPD